MPTISLTDFVDFLAKSGIPKLSHVRHLKSRGDYSPAEDFWRQLHDGIIEFHKSGQTNKKLLDGICGAVTDKKKRANYLNAVRQYKSFLGRKNVKWFKPPHTKWRHGKLSVAIEPDLGLIINGNRHIVTLYFKGTPLTIAKAEMYLVMMENSRSSAKPTDALAILDVQRKKLISSTSPSHTLVPLLEGEAQAFTTVWTQIRED